MPDFFTQLAKRRGEVSVDASRELAKSAPVPAPEFHETESSIPDLSASVERQVNAVGESGLFDADYYLATNSDVAEARMDPLRHFFHHGFRQGRQPNPYFDPSWYLASYPDIAATGVQPLLHYVLHGDGDNRRPGPLFETEWYRRKHGLAADVPALAHFLTNRMGGVLSPHPDFDAEYYATTYPDVADAGVDMFDHFIKYGYREGRNPSQELDVKFYVQRYLAGDTNPHPFFHWLENRDRPGVHGRMPDDEVTIPREVKRFTQPAPEFEEFRPPPATAPRLVKLLAYYLPQYHAFPENDAWWGRNFTEWTNLPRGLPRFGGHYQPRVPRDLGFYTLDDNGPMHRQVEMAKAAGVYGFVFYFYWFNGKRLLDGPVDRFLADPRIEMPFCLMWANENWTRRWDGAESEVLISQDYRPEDDSTMVAEFARHFLDSRYIRVGGRPLLMVYRPGLIPDPEKTIDRWRSLFRERFCEDPILIMSQSFGDSDPTVFGMEGAIEFPPHKLAQFLMPINSELKILDPDFTANVVRYEDVVRTSLEEERPAFPLIKTVVPSWDNDARRQGGGLVITDSNPAKYEAWLGRLVERAVAKPFFGEPMVCINAWNEWCEGAYLEPDLHFGSAYLNATGRAVTGIGRAAGQRIKLLLVGHDAFPSGAQQLLLAIARTLRRSFGLELAFLLLGGGDMESTYAELAPVELVKDEKALLAKLEYYARQGFRHALVNTLVAARAAPQLRQAGIAPTVLVHELPVIIRENGLAHHGRLGLRAARQVIYPASFVRDAVTQELGIEPDERSVIQPQGIYKEMQRAEAEARAVRTELGVAKREALVVGVGYADLRKGFDLFLQLWRQLNRDAPERVHVCWVGGAHPVLKDWLSAEIAAAEATGTFHLVGFRENVADYLTAANCFVLPSREDPFPSVALEAMSIGCSVVAFDGAGGIPDVLRELGHGIVVPLGDVDSMARAVATTIATAPGAKVRDGRSATVRSQFAFGPYVGKLLHLAMPDLASISVAVPNYNYARYMPGRLGSIFAQTHPVEEVIVLDDCSCDDSTEVIPRIAAEWGREVRLVSNTINSGSVFAQWRRAAELARGEYLWIAEADDLSKPNFLERVLAGMAGDPNMALGFSDSHTIDSDSTPQWASYKPYYAQAEPGALATSEAFAGEAFVRRFLATRNVILNVSSVLWRREALLAALEAQGEALRGFRMGGDWLLYLQALTRPGARLFYEAEPINGHRRHAESVTHGLDVAQHVDEIGRLQHFARERLTLPTKTLQAQRDYLAEIARQLGAPLPGLQAHDSSIEAPVQARPLSPVKQVATTRTRRRTRG